MIAEHIETRFFEFESDFVGSLKCIPMIVRYKLDTCRVKLKLPDWVKFNYLEKENLAQMACHSETEIAAYTDYVNQLAWKYSGAYPSLLADIGDSWNALGEVPAEVNAKAAEWECAPVSHNQWVRLALLERFALVKLSRSGHEGRNFPRAIREFFG